MPKTIESPVKKFPGHVILHDPLTFPMVFAFGDALEKVQETDRDDVLRMNYALLPGVLACVAEWHLSGFPEVVTVDSFPATPPVSAARVVGWLVGEITELYREADEIPLA